MARIALFDRGSVVPSDLEDSPLGGAESAFIELAFALARSGHDVFVRNNCADSIGYKNLHWAPLSCETPREVDLFIASRDPTLLTLAKQPKKRVLWLHNAARYLLRWRSLALLARLRPEVVFSSPYHLSTYPRWAPARKRVIIPYGVSEPFRRFSKIEDPPPPHAAFTSNPMRSLDWLINLWESAIHPVVPLAELHVFSGSATYGAWGAQVAPLMEPALARARTAASKGVVLREPLSKPELASELRSFRVLLYRGDPAETFCLAVAEAQALGLPCVVQAIGSVADRIVDAETGFVARDDREFALRAIDLLTDDALWESQHQAASGRQRHLTWDTTAARFEALLAQTPQPL